MKILQCFFTVCLLSSLLFTSCTKQNPLDQELPVIDDSALMLDLHESDALAGTGVVEEDNKLSYTIKYQNLPTEVQEQLLSKEEVELANDLKISGEVAKKIWGDNIANTLLEQGFTIPKGNHKINKTYMTPDGTDMAQAVKDDPTILEGAEQIDDYWIAVFLVHYDDEGNVIDMTLIYFEACIVITA